MKSKRAGLDTVFNDVIMANFMHYLEAAETGEGYTEHIDFDQLGADHGAAAADIKAQYIAFASGLLNGIEFFARLTDENAHMNQLELRQEAAQAISARFEHSGIELEDLAGFVGNVTAAELQEALSGSESRPLSNTEITDVCRYIYMKDGRNVEPITTTWGYKQAIEGLLNEQAADCLDTIFKYIVNLNRRDYRARTAEALNEPNGTAPRATERNREALEHIQDYVDKYHKPNNRYTMDINELQTLAILATNTPVEAISLAFQYGSAKGKREQAAADRKEKA